VRAVAVVLVLAACGADGIDPSTKIVAPRVLAITTEPSALVLDGEIALDVWTLDARGPRDPVVRLRACAPWKFISDPARDCAGADALALDSDTISEDALSAAFPSPPGTPAPDDPWRVALAAGIALRVPIIAEVDLDGQTLIARRDLEVVDEATPRQNPRIAEVRFDGVATGTLRAGTRYAVTVTIDRATLEVQPEAEDGALETVTVNLYSPTGEIEEPAVTLEDPETESTASGYTTGAAGSSFLFVVATDETGGQSATVVPLVIEP